MARLSDGPGPATTPVLVVGDGAAPAMIERLGACLECIAAAAAGAELNQLLGSLQAARRPCVYVGAIEPLIRALAPLLASGDVPDGAPLVAVADDGKAALALLGGARGGDALAEQVAHALAGPPPAGPPPGEVAAGLAVMAGAMGPGAPPGRSAGLATSQPASAVPRSALDLIQQPLPGPSLGSTKPLAAPRLGRLAVVGLGPGAAELIAPAAREELDRADDIVGYTTYVRMAGPFRPEQRILDSDNREEMDRARLAFSLAVQGRRVAVVSAGDPGVFGMAAAVLEAVEQTADPAWLEVELVVHPGISAAQAAAARAGAPLGHDFCVLSLSDNLKPWSQIERRLELAAAADLVIALYNPRSKARPWQLASALARLARHRAPDTPVVLGRDVGRPGERVIVTTLGEVQAGQVDMRTVVIVGSSQTRRLPRRDGGAWVYTPRWYPEPAAEPATAPAQTPCR